MSDNPFDLEEECDACGGRGWRPDCFGMECNACGGSGAVMTDFGREVYSFMVRHMPVVVIRTEGEFCANA